MRVLVVGLGSVGKRHVRNLARMREPVAVAVWRRSEGSDAEDVSEHVEAVFASGEEALAWRPDAAIVACPASSHVPVARLLAEGGVHLLVEKPLSHTSEGVEDLIDLCGRAGRVLMVGYTLRFDPLLRAVRKALIDGRIGRPLALQAEVGRYLPDWRRADYRGCVSGRRELGGGVLLELSHELDYARWLFGDVTSVVCASGRRSDLEIDVEDTADVLLRFGSGAMANIHLDMIQRAPTRTCRVIGAEGTLLWNGNERTARVYSADRREWQDLVDPAGPDAIPLDEVYRLELDHFVGCVLGAGPPLIDGREGASTLAVVLAAHESARTGRAVQL